MALPVTINSRTFNASKTIRFLENNGIDLSKAKATLGPLLSFDPDKEEFTGDLSNDANELVKGDYREGFQIPDVV